MFRIIILDIHVIMIFALSDDIHNKTTGAIIKKMFDIKTLKTSGS